MSEQILLTKKKKKSEEKSKEKKLADFWNETKLKKELKNLAIFGGLLAAAVGGRVALQAIPSVEPIIPLAVAVGLIFGVKEGFSFGGMAYIISNFFVWGLQGPWTIFQALGGALAGGLGGVMGKLKKPSPRDLIIFSVIGSVIFEVIMNLSGAVFGFTMLGLGLLSIPIYFITSLPFTALHIATNVVFAKLAQPLLKLKQEDEFKAISVSRVKDGQLTTIRVYKAEDN